MNVNFSCDLSGATIPLPRFWEHTVGSRHAPLALRADWQAQLKKSYQESGFRHVRFHGLLSYPMETLIIHKDEFFIRFLIRPLRTAIKVLTVGFPKVITDSTRDQL
jgi:xylan 1,4-beta-xylosidase